MMLPNLFYNLLNNSGLRFLQPCSMPSAIIKQYHLLRALIVEGNNIALSFCCQLFMPSALVMRNCC